MPGLAFAQDAALNIQQFAPAVDGDVNFVHVMGASSPGWLAPSFGLYANYAHRPLSIVTIEGGTETTSDLVAKHAQVDVLAALGLGRHFSLGVGMPVSVFLTSDSTVSITGVDVQQFALGDLRTMAKLSIIDKEKGPALALAAQVTLPTGDPASLQSSGALTYHPNLAFEWRFGDRLRVGVNGGYIIRTPETLIPTLTIENQITFGLGTQFALSPEKLALIAEVYGRRQLDGAPGTTPVEAEVAVRFWPAKAHAITVGAGPGITNGYGTPLFRAYLGYTFTGGGVARDDADDDDIVDAQDLCPNEPEDTDNFEDSDGCPDPDNDKDEVLDARDKCPNAAEDRDGFEDTDGCADPDNDRDGVEDKADKCPSDPETKNGIEDEDGCPEVDTDSDGIIDMQDKCAHEPENKNGVQDEDGCPEPDADGDGVVDPVDKCLKKPETMNGIDDEDGCPEADSDKDGIVDARDKCPKKAEVVNNFEDEDGCPDKAPPPAADVNADADADGIPDVKDKCPKKAETINSFEDEDGCPEADTDKDGIIDPKDRCRQKPETVNGFEDEDGCPDKAPAAEPEKPAEPEKTEPAAPADTDADGIPDAKDRCPKKAETVNNFKDEDGCPEGDADKDGIVDGIDKCMKKPETMNGFEDEDGCPDKAPAAEPEKPAEPEKAVPSGEIRDVKSLIFFSLDGVEFNERSLEVMNKMVAWLKANPEVRVRLQGFTDDQGTTPYNKDLSQRRVDAVRKYLMDNGIASERIEGKGFGERWPRTANDSDAGRAENRRVRLLPISAKGEPMEQLPADLDVPLPKFE